MRNALILSAVALAASCTTMGPATETEKALCEAWEQSLPTRSRSDTQQTQDEIGQARAMQRAVCK